MIKFDPLDHRPLGQVFVIPVVFLNASAQKLCRLEYFEVVDPATLRPVERADNSVLVIGAMWMGTTRLIDNMLC